MPPREQIYDPVATVKPRGPRDPSERVHIDFPSVHPTGAMGEAMSRAGHMEQTLGAAVGFAAHNLDRLAAQVEGAGDKIWNRAVALQELQNETTAKKAGIEYDTYVGQKNAEFSQKQNEGANADTLRIHMEDLQKKRQELSGKMPNDSARRMFDNHSAGTMVSGINHATEHAAKETRKAANGASEARINLNIDKFSKTDDIQESQKIMNDNYDEFWNTRAPLMQWGGDVAKEKWREIQERMYGSKIVRQADTDPTRALEMLEENKDAFGADKYAQVLHTVSEKQRIDQARNIGDRVKAETGEGTLSEREEAGDKKVKEIKRQFPNIDEGKLRDATRIRIRTDWNEGEREKRDVRNRNYELGIKAADGQFSPGRPLPTKIEELWAIDGFKEAWDGLHEAQQKRILKRLETNAKGDYPQTEETRRWTYGLKMQAQSTDPKEVEEFQKMDIESLPLPIADKKTLSDIQLRLFKREGFADPSVGHAWHVAQDLLPDSIRQKRGSAWKNFSGALGVRLQDELAANKGIPLKNEQIRDIVSHLLAYDPDVGWYNILAKKHFEQMSDPSAEDLRQIKDAHPELTDNQLVDWYRRGKWNTIMQHYRELSEKESKAKPKPTAPPGVGAPTSQ